MKDIVTDPEYLDVAVPARTTFARPVKRGHTVFAYVVEGSGLFDPERDPFAREAVGRNWYDMERKCVCGAETLVLYGEGDEVAITTEDGPVRFLLVSGKPIGEPVAWYGPIVMNTREELRIAFRECADGTFIRHQ